MFTNKEERKPAQQQKHSMKSINIIRKTNILTQADFASVMISSFFR